VSICGFFKFLNFFYTSHFTIMTYVNIIQFDPYIYF